MISEAFSTPDNRVAYVFSQYQNHSFSPEAIIDTYEGMISDARPKEHYESEIFVENSSFGKINKAIRSYLSNLGLSDIDDDHIELLELKPNDLGYDVSFSYEHDEFQDKFKLHTIALAFESMVMVKFWYLYGNQFHYKEKIETNRYALDAFFSLSMSSAFTEAERKLLGALIVERYADT